MKQFFYILSVSVFLPSIVVAQEYVPLTKGGVPGIDFGEQMSMPELLNKLFAISIAIAAVLAVIMLAIGGFKYMTSESAFGMGSAKENISGAIIGLLIVLLAVILLRTIHPDIVSLNLFS